MKILFVRHCDPDYSVDSLTPIGFKEAELLCERMVALQPTAVYCSPLGRAQDTARPFSQKLNLTLITCNWLREFDYAKIRQPYFAGEKLCWDLLPSFVAANPLLYDKDSWKKADYVKDSQVPRFYDDVCRELDLVLESHGYCRQGANYRAVSPNHDTIVFVCHYGITAALVSHLTNTSPYVIWQHFFAAPSSVTTIYTEERRQGIASMRCAAFGDTSHLYPNLKPQAVGRFCQCFTDDARHD